MGHGRGTGGRGSGWRGEFPGRSAVGRNWCVGPDAHCHPRWAAGENAVVASVDNPGSDEVRNTDGIPFLPFCGLAWLMWAGLILVTGTTLYVIAVVDAGMAYIMAAGLWGPYAALSPLAIWMVRRFPIRRPRLALWIGLHFCASLVFVSLSEAVSRFVLLAAEESMRGRTRVVQPQEAFTIPPNPVIRKPLFVISEVTGLPRPTLQMTLIKAQMNIPIYLGMLVGAEIVRARARIRDRDRQAMRLMTQLNESRLAGLRAQIQPHFLFNTLNSISVLILRDPRGANEMLLNLSELLRMSLRDDSTAGISLREELRMLRLYVGIQQIRFSDRLRFEEEIDEAALDAEVPTLFLQPLVENALRHGIEAAEEPGFVRLRVAVAGNRITIVIENSCPPDAPQPADADASKGIGLRNTAARLSAFFGESQQFEASRVSRGLFRVEIGFDRRSGGEALAAGRNT